MSFDNNKSKLNFLKYRLHVTGLVAKYIQEHNLVSSQELITSNSQHLSSPSIVHNLSSVSPCGQFSDIHLYSWAENDTARGKCLLILNILTGVQQSNR